MAFSKQSLDILSTVDSRLQEVCNEVIKIYDFSVICGYRDKAGQDAAVAAHTTEKVWPTSKHNTNPCLAVDIAPYPIDWNDKSRFILLAGLMTGVGLMKGYTIRWGGAWNGLKTMKDNQFNDLPHFEIVA